MFSLLSGNELRAESTPFARGGEGELYRIQHPAALRDYVLKVFHSDKRTPERQAKTEYLCAHPPVPYTPGYHTSVIWPTEPVMEDGRFVGLIMPLGTGEKLEILCGLKLQPRFRQHWGRFDHGAPESRALRMKLCFNIAVAVQSIHSAGRYALVDLKPENIIIQNNGLVSLVDMDSVEVAEGGQLLFASHVATPEFTPAEYYRGLQPGRDRIGQHWDMFGLGVIFYKLLLGVHPFSGSSHRPPHHELTTLEDMIREGLFPHGDKAAFMGVVPPPHTQFHTLPGELRELFIRCFDGGHLSPEHRPSAEEWCHVLAELLGIAPPAGLAINLLAAEPAKAEAGQRVKIRWQVNQAGLVYIDSLGFVHPEGEAELPAAADLALTAWDENGHMLSQNIPLDVWSVTPQVLSSMSAVIPPAEKKRLWALLVIYPVSLIIAFGWLEPLWQAVMVVVALLLPVDLLLRYQKSASRTETKRLQRELTLAEREHVHLTTAYEEVSHSLTVLNTQTRAEAENLLEQLQRLHLDEGPAVRTAMRKREAVRKKMETLSIKYNKLRTAEEEALSAGYEEAKEEMLRREMRRFGLLFQNLDGLPSADLDRLLEAGITSAADLMSVNPNTGDMILADGRKVHIRNIGPAKARILYDWLERVRRKAENQLPYPIPFPERDSIRAKYRDGTAELQSALEALKTDDDKLRLQLSAARDKDRRRQRTERDRTLAQLSRLTDDENYMSLAEHLRNQIAGLAPAYHAATSQVRTLTEALSAYRTPGFGAFLKEHFR